MAGEAQQRIITLLREGLPPAKRRRRLKKVPPFPSQVPQERFYRTQIDRLITPAIMLIRELVVPELDRLVSAAESERVNLDASGDDIERLFGVVRVRFAELFDDKNIGNAIEFSASRINRQNDDTHRRQIKTVLGIDPIAAEPWLEPLLQSHAAENVSLIKTLPNEAFSDIEQDVLRGVRSGDSTATISRQIQERWGTTQARARVIARDQTAKLTSQLNQNRQRQIGVKRYIWKDVDDERVRKTHVKRDGEIFEWGKPIQPQLREKGLKVDTIDGHPGEPIQCRCVPIPVLSDLV